MVVKPTDSNNIRHGNRHCISVNRSFIVLYHTMFCSVSVRVVLVLCQSVGANYDCFIRTEL